MSQTNGLRFGRMDTPDQTIPIGMIGKDKALIEVSPSALSPYGHPSGSEAFPAPWKSSRPPGILDRRRSNNNGAGIVSGFPFFDLFGRRQNDPRVPVGLQKLIGGGMEQDRTNTRVKPGKNPLSFSK